MTEKDDNDDNLSASTSVDCSINPESVLLTDSSYISLEHVLANVVNFDEEEIKVAIQLFEKKASLKRYWDVNTFKLILQPTFSLSTIEGIANYAIRFGNRHVSVTDFVAFLSSLACGPEAERFKNLGRLWDVERKECLSANDITRLCDDCGISPEERGLLHVDGETSTFDEVAIWGTTNVDVGQKMLRFLFLLVNVSIGYPNLFECAATLAKIVDDCVCTVKLKQFKLWVIVSSSWYSSFLNRIKYGYEGILEPEDMSSICETVRIYEDFHNLGTDVKVLRKGMVKGKDYVAIPFSMYSLFVQKDIYNACIRSCDVKFNDSLSKYSYILDLFPPFVMFIRSHSDDGHIVETVGISLARKLDIDACFAWLLKYGRITTPSRLRLIQQDGFSCDVLLSGGETLESLKVKEQAAFFIEEKIGDVWTSFENQINATSASTSVLTSSVINNYAIGLSNLGNTCYFNSVIQCLSSLSFSRKFFLPGISNMFNKFGNPLFVTELSKLFVLLQNSNVQHLSPTKLLSVFQTKTGDGFPTHVQHDAHEALIAILNIIHSEMADNSSKSDLILETTDALETTKLRWIHNQKREGSSPIACFFTGAIISNLTCRVCLNQSPTIESFQTYDVTLDQVSGCYFKYLVVNKDYTSFCAKVKYLSPDATLKSFLNDVASEINVPLNCLFFYVQSKSDDDNKEYNRNPNFLMSIFADKDKETFIIYELPKPLSDLKYSENYVVCYQLLLNKSGFTTTINQFQHKLFHVDIPLIVKVVKGLTNEMLYDIIMKIFSKMKDTLGSVKYFYRRAHHQNSKDKYPFHLIHVDGIGQHCSRHNSGIGCRVLINEDLVDFNTLCSIGILWKVMPYFLDYRNVVNTLHSTSAETQILAKHSDAISLLDCLSKASCPELIDGLVDCEKCKRKRMMTKTYTIYLAPAVFVVNFKRFIMKGNSYTKDTRKVVFPLDDLDLKPFVFDNMPVADKYQCVAFIIHQGSLFKGHYTAFIRKSRGWFMISDDSVMQVTTDELCLSDAVLVFYEMTNPESPLAIGHPLEDYVREELRKFRIAQFIAVAAEHSQ